jgi:hypothetical protein
MKIYKLFYLLLPFLGVVACQEYEPQFEGPYDDATNNYEGPVIDYQILFVHEGLIKLADEDLLFTKNLDVGEPVDKASINYSHDRIAYKNAASNIKIVDADGNLLDEVPDTESVIWFDWHANNETLYMLEDGQLSFFGPSIDGVAQTDLNSVFIASNLQFFSAAVTADGSVLGSYEYNSFSGVKRGIIVLFSEEAGESDYFFENSIGYYQNRIRVDQNGAFATYSSGPQLEGNNDQRQLDIVGKQTRLLFSGTQAAISPDGNNTITAQENPSRITIGISSVNSQLDVGGGNITDLDW